MKEEFVAGARTAHAQQRSERRNELLDLATFVDQAWDSSLKRLKAKIVAEINRRIRELP